MSLGNKYAKKDQEIKAARAQIDERNEEMNQRQELLMNYEREINQKILDYQQAQHSEIRRQVEQSVDFALRSLPWWVVLFSIQMIMNRANRFYEVIKSQVLLKSVQAMTEELQRQGEDPLAQDEAGGANTIETPTQEPEKVELNENGFTNEQQEQFDELAKKVAEKLDDESVAKLRELGPYLSESEKYDYRKGREKTTFPVDDPETPSS